MTPQNPRPYGPREAMEYDVVVVGAGPGGPGDGDPAEAAGRRAGTGGLGGRARKRLRARRAHPVGRDDGSARDRPSCFPNWKERGAPLNQPVTADDVPVPRRKPAPRRTPDFFLPDCLTTTATTSSASATWSAGWRSRPRRWASRSSPALPPPKCSTTTTARVKGVATGNVGIGKDGEPHESFQLGMELHGKYTIFAEGARGHLGKQLIAQLQARRRPRPAELRHRHQGAVGSRARQGQARPRGAHRRLADGPDTYGGGFLYHLEDNKVTLGFVVGLDYTNPWLSPFEEMQRWKTHPAIREHLEGGKRIGYGARAITAGGILSLPKTVFPGGALVGCDAGYLNASRIKGSHAAIKTGMLAPSRVRRARRRAPARRAGGLPGGVRDAAGCTRNSTARATSSSGSRRATRRRR